MTVQEWIHFILRKHPDIEVQRMAGFIATLTAEEFKAEAIICDCGHILPLKGEHAESHLAAIHLDTGTRDHQLARLKRMKEES